MVENASEYNQYLRKTANTALKDCSAWPVRIIYNNVPVAENCFTSVFSSRLKVLLSSIIPCLQVASCEPPNDVGNKSNQLTKQFPFQCKRPCPYSARSYSKPKRRNSVIRVARQFCVYETINTRLLAMTPLSDFHVAQSSLIIFHKAALRRSQETMPSTAFRKKC